MTDLLNFEDTNQTLDDGCINNKFWLVWVELKIYSAKETALMWSYLRNSDLSAFINLREYSFLIDSMKGKYIISKFYRKLS